MLIHGHASGGTQSATYRSWLSMWSRIMSKEPHKRSAYAGRGIVVCEQWKDFAVFLADMGERPDLMSLDRIDTNGNYEPGNCRWATARDQARNRRDSIWLTVDGCRMHLHEAAALFGIKHKTVLKRVSKGWSLGKAIVMPARSSRV